MVLPSPVFRIDSTDYVGDENFIIELSLDKKTPIKVVSYTPISGEKAVFDKEKKKRLIRLICRVKGKKVYDEKKEVGDIQIKLEDADLVIKEVLGKMRVENTNVL